MKTRLSLKILEKLIFILGLLSWRILRKGALYWMGNWTRSPSDSTIPLMQYFPVGHEWLIWNNPGIEHMLPEENDEEHNGQNSCNCVSGWNELKIVQGENIRNSVTGLNLASSINAQIMWSEIFPYHLGQFSRSWLQSRADRQSRADA